MTEVKHYWSQREVSASRKVARLVKRGPVRAVADVLLSVRASDEAFIARVLRKRKVKSVLDLACGSGKAVIPSIAGYTAGVDITGFPAGEAKESGYSECIEYDPPDYEFRVSREVDAITVINLNAHIPTQIYHRILRNGLSFLKARGTVLIINEYDNDGASYKWMRRDPAKFDRFVRGMEHWHLEHEEEFLKKLNSNFDDLELVERQPLTAGLLPAVHYYAYSKQKNPNRFLQKFFLLADVPISLLNTLQRRFASNFNKSFLVGYVYQRKL